MRVLHVVKGLGPGGAERLLVSLAAATDPAVAALEVAYVLAGKQHLVAELEASGCRTHLLAASRGLADPRWVGRLARLARRFDVVHVHSPAVATVARPVLRAVAPRVRLVSTEHNVWGSHARPTRALNGLTAPFDHRRLAVSESVRASMWARLQPGCEVLEHGVPLASLRERRGERASARAALGITADDVLVVTVANLRAQKDYPNLFAAAVTAIGREPRLRFVSIGQGPLEAELRTALAALDLGDRFTMLGYHPDPPAVVAGADLFALGSRHEGLPIALVEAMAMGVAPVVTAVGGVAEIVTDGRDGLLVPPNDPAALTDALVRLAQDSAERARLAEGAMTRTVKYDIAGAADRLTAVYEALVPH